VHKEETRINGRGRGGEVEKQKEKIFKRNNKLVRSPVGKEMRKEMRELVGEELMAEMRKGMKVTSEEIRKATGDQKETLKMEAKRIKEEWRIREEKWNMVGKNLKEG